MCGQVPEAGEAQIVAVLERQPYWRIDTIGAEEVPAGLAVADDSCLRIASSHLADVGGANVLLMARSNGHQFRR